MALSYNIVSEAPQARIVSHGAVTMSAMIDSVERLAADPRFDPQFTVTLDLREATYTAELADGDALSAVLNRKKGRFQNRFAVVVPEALHFLARLYCALATVGGFDKIRCFTSMDEAETWCRKQP